MIDWRQDGIKNFYGIIVPDDQWIWLTLKYPVFATETSIIGDLVDCILDDLLGPGMPWPTNERSKFPVAYVIYFKTSLLNACHDRDTQFGRKNCSSPHGAIIYEFYFNA